VGFFSPVVLSIRFFRENLSCSTDGIHFEFTAEIKNTILLAFQKKIFVLPKYHWNSSFLMVEFIFKQPSVFQNG